MTSKSRGIRLTSVVLPAPVLPTMAVVWPGRDTSEMSVSTGSSAPGYANPTSRSSSTPGRSRPVTGDAGTVTDGSVSSTSWIRSAHTAARGMSTAMNVAIITAIRIWAR